LQQASPEVFGNDSEWLASIENPTRFPALFLEFLPKLSDKGSLLVRLTGRTEDGVIVRSAADPEGCFEGWGGFLAVMDGDGDCVEDFAPFVWMAEGTGRFILVAPFCCIVGVTTGAIMSDGKTRRTSRRRLPLMRERSTCTYVRESSEAPR
jgi:hypothetical protein